LQRYLRIALIYFLAIAPFGACYWRLPPDNFYHAYIQYEPDSQQRLALLSTVLLNDFVALKGAKTDFRIGAYPLQGLRFTRNDSRFDAEYYYRTNLGGKSLPTSLGRVCRDRSSNYSKWLSVVVPVQSVGERYVVADFATSKPLDECDKVILGFVYKNLGRSPDKRTYQAEVMIAPGDAVLLKRVPEEQSGEAPLDFQWSRFLRMIYLSTSAITTTGFGDIVPQTPLARLLVGIEECLGIVLAGLFVSTLFRELNIVRETGLERRRPSNQT
jgi:hypothetical protein